MDLAYTVDRNCAETFLNLVTDTPFSMAVMLPLRLWKEYRNQAVTQVPVSGLISCSSDIGPNNLYQN